MRSITSRLLRKTLQFSRVYIESPKQHQAHFFSSSSSTSLSSALRQVLRSHRQISPLGSFRFLSSAAAKNVTSDEKLRRVIESEIECAESDVQDQGVLPDDFPFEIIDNPGEQTITLKREVDGESIQVEVHMPDMDGENDEQDDDDDDDGDDNDDSNSSQYSISLIVNVVKGEGHCLEFSCTATPDEITIDSMLMKDPNASPDQIPYEGPDFSDLDENLQKAFYTFLEERGIRSSLTNFLQEYMINKDNREYLTWLKSMKEFVEK